MLILFNASDEFNYEDHISYKTFLFDINDGQLIICEPIDDFDINSIEPWKINVFNIRLLTFEEASNIILNETRNLLIQEESGGYTLQRPLFDEDVDYKDKLTQPYEGWVWDKDLLHWKAPKPRPDCDLTFRVKWNNQWQDWEMRYGRDDLPRERKSYQLWYSQEVDGSSMFHNACSTVDYMIKPFENITHNTKNIENLIKSYNDQIASTSEIVRPYMSIGGHLVVIDLSPFALITYSECHEDAVDMFNELYSMHPQFLSRTPWELFRLIIEWAYSHSDLGNNELAAVTCHRVLQAVQMPKSIRDSLIAMPAQQVGKYLENNLNALSEDTEGPEAPEGFDKWINTVYYHYPHLKKGQEPHIDSLPNEYPT